MGDVHAPSDWGELAPPAPRVPRRVRKTTERFIEGHRVRLLRDGAEAFPAMLGAIETAREQVLLEMYWFASDRIGRRFAAALSSAAQRGVEVAVIYDSVGSWETDDDLFLQMMADGVKVVEYNPVMPYKRRFRLDRLTRRDHRKLLIADGSTGFTGGLNIADQWLPESEEGGGWRDDVIEVRGPAVTGMVECFMADWTRQGGAPIEVRTGIAAPAPGTQSVRVIGQAHWRQRREIVRAYLYNVYTARRRVWLTNSYFIPDPAVARALMRAARRGVDVRVLLPGRSDVGLVRFASRAIWPKLMRRGVRIYEWIPGILHAKTAVIDGRWSTIGTYNLDTWSRLYNLEVNVAVLDAGFARVMEQSFLRDLESSREVDEKEFRFRPLGERLLERLAYWVRGWL